LRRQVEIELLVNNAGFGAYGEFATAETQRLLDMVKVNCGCRGASDAPLPAADAEAAPRRRADSGLDCVFQAVPFISTYAATKAFDLLFAEGLAEEVRPYGIRVCALWPRLHGLGVSRSSRPSEFGCRDEESGTAEKVARVGLQALAAGKSYVISGMGNYLGAHSQRLVPRRFVTRITARMFRPPAAKSA